MKFSQISILVVAVLLIGCGGPKVKEAEPANQDRHVGLDPSKIGTPRGDQSITAPDGTETEVLQSAQPGSFGLAAMPTARLKDGAAYKRTSANDETILMSLVVGDTFETTRDFYASELKSAPQMANSGEAILTGKLSDSETAVVTVIRLSEKETSVEVQIIKNLKS